MKRRYSQLLLIIILMQTIMQPVHVQQFTQNDIIIQLKQIQRAKSQQQSKSSQKNRTIPPQPNKTTQPETPPQPNQQQPQKQSQIKLVYKHLKTSRQYYSRFEQQLKQIPHSQVINVTSLSNGREKCLQGKQCQYYYYIIQPKTNLFKKIYQQKQGNNQSSSIRNVVLVSGMHGNQYLGPHTLLYLLKHLKNLKQTRIILFPLANPSGFQRNSRQTFPTKVDPNRDFPIEQYNNCYQSSSTIILDSIFRKFKIDLTLSLHNGATQIGWNWGTINQNGNSHTLEEPISRQIGEWMKFLGGFNSKNQMTEFNIGTMDQSVYPVPSTFDDWAYAASWYQKVNPKNYPYKSKNCQYQPYPENLTNGLVFLFELGPFDVPQSTFGQEIGVYMSPTSQDSRNGHISRAVRMFSELVKVVNPRLNIKLINSSMIIKLEGCQEGMIWYFKVYDQASNLYYDSKDKKFLIQGNINNFTTNPSSLKLDQNLFPLAFIEKNLTIQYNLECDSDWQGKGNTVFGKKRIFQVKQHLLLIKESKQMYEKTYFESLDEALKQFSEYQAIENYDQKEVSIIEQLIGNDKTMLYVLYIIGGLLVIGIIVYGICIIIRQMKKDLARIKQKKIQKVKQQLEQINQNQQISSNSFQNPTQSMYEDQTLEQNQPQAKRKPQPSIKEVDHYPQLCESDKSINNEKLEQIVQLQQFIEKHKYMIQDAEE